MYCTLSILEYNVLEVVKVQYINSKMIPLYRLCTEQYLQVHKNL